MTIKTKKYNTCILSSKRKSAYNNSNHIQKLSSINEKLREQLKEFSKSLNNNVEKVQKLKLIQKQALPDFNKDCKIIKSTRKVSLMQIKQLEYYKKRLTISNVRLNINQLMKS